MISLPQLIISIILSVTIGSPRQAVPNVDMSQMISELQDAAIQIAENAAAPDPDEVDLLARLIYQEAGCDWIPDYVILWVGSVALNRVESDKYPDTLYEVIYDPGQYEPAITGSISLPANERCIRLAELLLREGSMLPPNVLGQCGWPTGSGVYATYYDEVLDTTIYFCIID